MQAYKISEEGELISVPLKDIELRSDDVVVIVEDNKKNIFIWKGINAPVRKKFISARSAWKLRGELGPLYKVVSIDEGEEPEDFLNLIKSLNISVKTTPPAPAEEKPKVEAPPLPAPKPAPPKPRRRPAVALPPKVEKPPEIKKPAKVEVKKPVEVKVEKPPEVKPVSPSPVEEIDVRSILSMLEGLDTPPEYSRELLIVGTRIYALGEVRTKLFGKEKVKLSVEILDALPEGPYLAEGYIPRVIIKNDQVLAVELLKKTRATVEEIKKEIRKGLETYTSLIRKLEKEE
ncbi:MAG: hypothetical protein J7J30_04690 [Candidatus Odinarchaeota archaeon]|nr:hypothetical protein [Candidatus Odinarchaeota archaeon]